MRDRMVSDFSSHIINIPTSHTVIHIESDNSLDRAQSGHLSVFSHQFCAGSNEVNLLNGGELADARSIIGSTVSYVISTQIAAIYLDDLFDVLNLIMLSHSILSK
jgi:hypothetical protein